MLNRKEAPKMTDVLSSIENIVDYYDETTEKEFKGNKYIDMIILYLKGKAVLKNEKSKEILKEYIVRENGKEVIKGTRLTYEDIVRVFNIKQGADIKDFLDEYPSLENEYQIVAGLLMYVKKNCTLRKVMFNI